MALSTVDANLGPLILHGVDPTGKEIGRGAYGRVFEVDYQGTLCAAKEVHALLLEYAQGDDLQKIKDGFLNECQIWSKLRHPCVVQFLGLYHSAMDQYRLPVIVMEKMQHSLRGLVEKYDNIPLNVKLSILNEVCLGLRYLHSRNPPIVHRDLTPNNILLSYRLEAKITDLGVAKVLMSDNPQNTMTKLPGTPDFMPPEALTIKPVYGPSLDVFSFGGVILNVTTQLWPQPTDRTQFNPETSKWEVVSEVNRRQQHLDKMTGGAADLKPLVISCLDDNPQNRPTVVQVSMIIKEAKDVCSQKSGNDGMIPIVWWAKTEQQSQVTNSLTATLEETTISVEQLGKEIDLLKTDNSQLRNNSDLMTNEIKQLKVSIDKQKDEIAKLKAENQQLKLLSNFVNVKWEEGATAPVNFCEHTAVWLNGLVYVGGGYRTGFRAMCIIYCYDPVNNLWGSSVDTSCCWFAMTSLNNKLVIAGGRISGMATSKIFTMEADHDQLNYYTNMKTPRSRATAAGHQRILLITGGRDSLDRALSSTELFDSDNGQWYTCDDLPMPRCSLKSVIVENVLYMLGGSDEKYRGSAGVFSTPLDTLSRHWLKWNVQQDTPWHYSTPVCVFGSQLLIVGGGEDSVNMTSYSNIYKLSKTNHSWEAVEQKIPSGRSSSAAICTPDNKIIVVGGYNLEKNQPMNTLWIGLCEPQY